MFLIVLAVRTSLLFVFRFVLFSCRLAFFLGSLSRSVFSCCCLFSYFLCDCVLCSLYARTRWSCFPVALSFSCSSGYVCCSPRASSCFLLFWLLSSFLVIVAMRLSHVLAVSTLVIIFPPLRSHCSRCPTSSVPSLPLLDFWSNADDFPIPQVNMAQCAGLTLAVGAMVFNFLDKGKKGGGQFLSHLGFLLLSLLSC